MDADAGVGMSIVIIATIGLVFLFTTGVPGLIFVLICLAAGLFVPLPGMRIR